MSNTEDSWQNTSPENRELEAIYGSWENFCNEVHLSIGRKIGSGVMTFPTNSDGAAPKAKR
ncbi:MAG: hypothetical protein WCD79_08820 [Chthoniobacteraceae bacterium]